ncbi:MAG: hypothetical protein DYG92_09930 [Leptolyngbya sp. PLA1]|nr:hypothetical protein [Leptolyngbya sp. PLA1]
MADTGLRFDIRFQHGSGNAALVSLHQLDDAGKPMEAVLATVCMHLIGETEIDATLIIQKEDLANQAGVNDLLLRLNSLMHGRGKRTLRHAELFVQSAPPAGPDRPIAGLHVLSNVSTPTSHRLWLREAESQSATDGPVVALVDVVLTNQYMATLLLVPFDSRLNSEGALRSLIQWVIDAVPFLAERKSVMQEMSIKAHPCRYLGGADVRQQEPERKLPDAWPGA